MQNPLFPDPNPGDAAIQSPQPANAGSTRRIEPVQNPAVELIRRKIQELYAEEPNAKAEIAEISQIVSPQSKHQKFMQELSNSGRSFAEIQTAWHEYYVSLPDDEKYVVWQEFYASNQTNTTLKNIQSAAPQTEAVWPEPTPSVYPEKPRRMSERRRTASEVFGQASTLVKERLDNTPGVGEIKKRILSTVESGRKIEKKQHLKSLAFGLASGLVVLFIFLFSFFNEIIIAPFIQPSRQASETPVIIDPASTIIGGSPKVLIPKINVEIPVDYTQTTTEAKAIERALDNGVVHYPTTARPGQAGNASFFGHSSNNIFNPGKYKFAFVLLHKLEVGDLFYLSNEGTTYAYRVFDRKIVKPTEVSVLNPIPGKIATATLITCDPPGTSINRLIVVGEQISPDPNGAQPPKTKTPVLTASTQQSDLPGNGPTLWSRIWQSIF